MDNHGIVKKEALVSYKQLLNTYSAMLQNHINYINKHLNDYARDTELDDNFADHSKLWSAISQRMIHFQRIIEEKKKEVERTISLLFPE